MTHPAHHNEIETAKWGISKRHGAILSIFLLSSLNIDLLVRRHTAGKEWLIINDFRFRYLKRKRSFLSAVAAAAPSPFCSETERGGGGGGSLVRSPFDLVLLLLLLSVMSRRRRSANTVPFYFLPHRIRRVAASLPLAPSRNDGAHFRPVC